MSDNIRIEEDLLGTKEVPADVYYGVHTLRAVEDFYISNNKASNIPESVRGMVIVRKAVTTVNKELQTIPKNAANAIIATCDKVPNGERCIDQFPVDVYQDDAGTSVNMNTNEVLANIGLELMSHQKGEHQYLSPNDHVNKCQSTNDAYLTGLHIVVYSSLIKLVNAISQLREGSERKVVEFQDILGMGRTQLQDIIPMIFSQEFHAFSILLKEGVKNIQHIAKLLLEVDLGAITIGTGLNTLKEYSSLAVKKLAEVTDFPYIPAEDLIEATSDYGAYVMIHGVLEHLTVKMLKIRNDLRLLSSGPRTGLNEINLPELQADFSVMPAKANPVVPKVVNQVCFKVTGNDTTVTMAAEAGQLQLNAMEPAIGQAVLESVHILINACYNLLEKCINGITADKEVCEGYVYNSIGIVTYLNPFIGHHNGDIVGKICVETGKSVRKVVLGRGLLTKAELDNILPIQNLMHPTYKMKRHTDESEQ